MSTASITVNTVDPSTPPPDYYLAMRRAVFLDRDDTIIVNDGDLGDPAEVRLVRGAAHAIGSLRQLGYRIIVVSNQGGVARGRYSERDVDAVHQRIAQLVHEASGAVIDRFYYCPFHPDGTVPEYAKEHPWRKPQPGMLMEAASALDLDLSECWMVGDSERDIEAGAAAGCKTILIAKQASVTTKADFQVATIAEAASIIAQNRTRPGSPRPALHEATQRIGASARIASPDQVESLQENDFQNDAMRDDDAPRATVVDDAPADASETVDEKDAPVVATVPMRGRPPTAHAPVVRPRRAGPPETVRHPPEIIEPPGGVDKAADTDDRLRPSSESGLIRGAQSERLLIEVLREMRSWRHSDREFTPRKMAAVLTILSLTIVAVLTAIYVEPTAALTWIGVILVAQIGVAVLVILGLRG